MHCWDAPWDTPIFFETWTVAVVLGHVLGHAFGFGWDMINLRKQLIFKKSQHYCPNGNAQCPSNIFSWRYQSFPYVFVSISFPCFCFWNTYLPCPVRRGMGHWNSTVFAISSKCTLRKWKRIYAVCENITRHWCFRWFRLFSLFSQCSDTPFTWLILYIFWAS